MRRKLTLTIDEEIISRAKAFARKSNRSLSDIIEKYLETVTNLETEELDKELKKLVGIIQLPDDFDEKQFMRDHASLKHL